MKGIEITNNYIDQLKAFIYGLFLYLNIDKEIAFILVMLITADMITGSLKTIFVKELTLSVNEFWKGLIKKALLLIVVMVLALISKGLGFSDFKIMVTIVMKAMLLGEGISVINNIRSVYDKKEYKSSDLITMIIEKISEFLNLYLEKILSFFDIKDKNK